MRKYRRIGVFLHDSPADDEALAFAARVAELANSESVLCIHVRESDEAEDSQPNAKEFQAQILKRLPPTIAARTKVELHGGEGVPAILRGARDLELDLVVVGRRLPSEQLGIGSEFTRLARKCPCDVLVVPNFTRTHLGRMLVPIDFSQHAKLALEQAIALVRTGGEPHPEVVAHSIYSIGYGYTKTGVSLPKAAGELEEITQNKLRKFVADVDTTGIAFDTICTCAESVQSAVHDFAAVRKMDMIVVGSRGLNWPAAALLGSTAERILVTSPLPVLIVKKKGETTHLLNALLGDG